ncbi:MAG: hypothetical protein ACJZ8O_08010 [Pirellulaceae bacterium]
MNDSTAFRFQRIVEEINTAMAAGGHADADLLAETASQYGEATSAINVRLQSAHDLLQKGMASEAIQECELEPNLLNMVQILDFPQRLQWYELIQSWGWPAPPELRVDLAGALDKSYFEVQAIDVLLRQYRLLALGRAPLEQRMQILQQLIQRDPGNPLWQNSLREFELERINQIKESAEAAIFEKDRSTIEAHYAELTQQSWYAEVPQDLVQRLLGVLQQFHAGDVTLLIRQTVGMMRTAHENSDVSSVRNLFQTLHSYNPTAYFPTTDPLIIEIGEIKKWLSQSDADGKAQRKREELDRRFMQAIDKSDLEIAEKLVRRLEQAGSVLDTQKKQLMRLRQQVSAGKKRKTMFIVLGTLGIIALAVTLVVIML